MNNFLDNLTSAQRKLVIAIMAIIVFVVSTTVTYSIVSPTKIQNGSSSGSTANATLPGSTGMKQEDPSIPRTEQCPLNGSMQTKNAEAYWQKNRPLAVMIENHIEARPQSGLGEADVVYEAVAEGGITRFMAVFYCGMNFDLNDVQVGPVRSARTYFLDWLSEYDALYAHVGGANSAGPADALGQIITYKIKDLNQFSIGFPTYWRDYERIGHPVATEHTMYSTTKKLWDAGAKKGWTNVDTDTGVKWDAAFVPWKFKDDQAGGTTKTITVNFWESQKDYQVEWDYDQSCNCYMRKNAGQPHMDLDTNKQLSPKVVIVRMMAESHANDGYENNVHLLYADNGTKGAASGKALIFQDGKVTTGTWNKKNRLARETFLDDNGKEIQLNRGQIWLEAIPTGSTVNY